MGFQAFLDRLRGAVADGRSLIVAVPSGFSVDSLWEALRTELWRRSFSVVEVLTVPDAHDRLPIEVLAEALGARVRIDGPPSPDRLLARDDLPDVVYVAGLERVSPQSQSRWLSLFEQWAQSAQGRMDSDHEVALCAVVPANTDLDWPQTNVRLAVYWWWDVISMLEVRLVCRAEADGDTVADEWRELLLPAMAGPDLGCAAFLWEKIQGPVDQLAQHLAEYGESQGWSAERLGGWGAERFPFRSSPRRSGPEPPADLRPLWATGAAYCTWEFGPELHSSALALLGRRDDLSHRLWRGQAGPVLAAIDQARLTICGRFTRAYGSDWPLRWILPGSQEDIEAVRRSPLGCQLGHLEQLLRSVRAFRSEQRLLRVVEQARWARNELAHYRPLTYAAFDILRRELSKIEE
jgi:hypothetical protein